MANNPFYPGYVSDKPVDGSASPLYPGYYAGKPISRRPQSKNFLKPIGEYNVDEFFYELDNLGSGSIKGVPTYIRGQLVDDFKQALKATYRPPDVDITSLDDYDPDVLPGVSSVSLSLNPLDWVDPKKQLEQTAKDWIKSTTGVKFAKAGKGWGITGIDLEDYENRVNTKMWTLVTGLHNEDLFDTEGQNFEETSEVNYKRRFSSLEKEGKEAIEGRTLAGANYTPANAKAPLSFTSITGGNAEILIDGKDKDQDGNRIKINALQNQETGSNYAKDVGTAIVEFERNAKSGLRRDTAYDKYLLATLNLAHNEMNVGRRDEILNSITDPTARKEAEAALGVLELRANIHKDISGLGAAVSGGAGATTRMQKMITGAVDASELGITRDTKQGFRSTFVQNGVTYDAELGRRMINARTKAADLLTYTKDDGTVVKGKIDKWIEQTKDLDPAMAQKMTAELEQLRAYATNLTRQLDFADVSNNEGVFAATLNQERARIKQVLSGGDTPDKENVLNLLKKDSEYAKLFDPSRTTDISQSEAKKLLDSINADKSKHVFGAAQKEMEGLVGYHKNVQVGLKFSGRRVEGPSGDAKVTQVVRGEIDERALNRSIKAVRDAKGRPLSGGTMFEGSIERGFLMQFESDALLPGSTKGINGAHQIGSLLARNEVRGLNLYSSKARVVMNRMNVERVSYQMEEFTKSMQDGKIIENYVWKPLVTRITGYTPADLTTQFLKKRHYFGLLIDDDYVTKGQTTNKLFNALYKNKIRVEVDGKLFSLAGGNHFQALLDLNGGSVRFAQGGLLDAGMNLTGKAYDEEFKKRMMMLLTGEARLTEGVGKDWKVFSYLGAAGREDFQLRIDRLRAWLNSSENKTGIKAIKGNENKLWSLMEALRKENSRPNSLKITKQYAGLMDRVGPWLNRIQTRIFDSFLFKKLVKPVLQLKTIIKERVVQFISAAIAKLLNGAITAATGGIGIVLTPILEKILKPIVGFLVNKTTAYFQSFMSGLLHGDWQALMKQWEKEVSNTIKWGLAITAVPVFIIMLFTWAIMSVISTTISPIDPTKGVSGYGSIGAGGGVVMPNENAYMRVTKDVDVTTSSGTVTNPGPPIPNEELLTATGVYAEYTVTITAKQAVPAGVVWYDFTTQSQSTGGTSIFQTGPNILPAMSQGETITITAPDIGTHTYRGGDEDSIISNVIMIDFAQASGMGDVETITYTRQFGIGNVTTTTPNCEGLPAAILPPQVSSPGPGGQIAARAYEIATGLQRGFWCNFNHSNAYPELWNQGRFEADPFPEYPGSIQNEPNSLFWCTWMVAKSYTSVWGALPMNQAGLTSTTLPGFPDVAGSWYHQNIVQNNVNYMWMPRESTPVSQIQPGDIIFFRKYGRLAHVGIVYSKTSDSITTIESNNFVVSVTIPTENCGSGDCPVSPVVPADTDMLIWGFGRHR